MEETKPLVEEPEEVVPVTEPIVESVDEPVEEIAVPVQEGLRQRKTSSKASASTDKTVAISSGKRTERYIVAIADKIPEQARPYVVKVAPVVGVAVDFGESMIPHVIAAYKKFEEIKLKLAPFQLQILIPTLVGLIMCFFGGTFVTLIAAVEAYRLVGWKTTAMCCTLLWEDFKSLEAANAADDSKDDDNDGIPDVLQISNEELMKRKLLLFLRTVDPKRITDAIGGINAGFLAVAATLKMQFAKAITLGTAIAEKIKIPAQRYIVPYIESLLPDEYKKWGQVIVYWHIDGIAISTAWTVQRVISAYHSALIGGLMASRNMLEYLTAMKIYEINHEDTYIDEFVGYGLSAIGFLFQISGRFSLPFPLNVLLFPLTLLEWFLQRVVFSA